MSKHLDAKQILEIAQTPTSPGSEAWDVKNTLKNNASVKELRNDN